MATAAEQYKLPRFDAFEGDDVVRVWANLAKPEELMEERDRMREMCRQFPRYLVLMAWLETVADLRGIDIYPRGGRLHVTA